MQNRHCTGRHLRRTGNSALREAEHIAPNIRRIDTVVTAEQGQDQLAEYAPHEALLCPLTLEGEVLDHPTEVAVAAVLHIQVQVLGDLQVLTVIVGDDVGVAEGREDLELGVELFALLLRHAQVGDFLAAHDKAVRLSAHLADDTEGAMACVEEASVTCARMRAEVRQWERTNLLQRVILVFRRHHMDCV